ncbi:MAG: hypothetical protein HY226_00680 [Candidatus Vogelbacteria bacterium]|nr:hypothetical protein [Candidatus Vogelbacteria bacterium]
MANMNILGINCYGHDSAATLVCDGKVVFSAEEERLNRIKHSGAFPSAAIAEALRFCEIDFAEIEHVAFPWNPSITYSKVPIYIFRYWKTLPALLRERHEFSMEDNLVVLDQLKNIKQIPNKLSEIFSPGKKGMEVAAILKNFRQSTPRIP